MILMNIFDTLGRKSPNKIVRLFLENPAAEMQVKDIISATKLAKLSVLRWSKELAKDGILSVSAVGRARIYRLNRNNIAVKQLGVLYNVDYVSRKIGTTEGGTKIFVYGSFARGENAEKSDIDLLVIGKNREIIKKLKAVDSRVKVSFYTPVEWSMAARKDRAFFESAEKDKIQLR